jgi:DNA repair protein RadC
MERTKASAQKAAEIKAPYSIAAMPAEDRPREKLRQRGADALSDAELVAIFLRTGMKGRSAIDLAKDLLRRHPLTALVSAPLEELSKTKGIGPTKAVQLKAAFEVARRLSLPRQRILVNDPGTVAGLVREDMRDLDREEFRVLLLNTKNALLRIADVSRGSLNASIVEPREVFKDAIAASAAGVILVHNHPSGDSTPSSEDIAVTKRMVKAGELLNIAVMDHIILGHQMAGRDRDYVSLKELGLM